MLATRWEPFAEFNRLSHEMDRLFGRYGAGTSHRLGIDAYPAINMWEDDDHTYVEAELPGFTAEDIEVLVTGNELSLKGMRAAPTKDSGKWHRRERGFGEFLRTIDLPYEVAEQDVAAEFRNGVLTITLPKSPAAKTRRIAVKAK